MLFNFFLIFFSDSRVTKKLCYLVAKHLETWLDAFLLIVLDFIPLQLVGKLCMMMSVLFKFIEMQGTGLLVALKLGFSKKYCLKWSLGCLYKVFIKHK